MRLKAAKVRHGSVTIPAELRKKYKITPGTKIAFIDEGNCIRLQPINKPVGCRASH
jgi:bifunctional DNA-binding transcriptional regulator/antitoxin component of YhaV-PrlF toxin-antitoxin module